MNDEENKIYLDGDFSDGYESRVRASKGKAQIKQTPVPAIMQHLKRDARGYPIPYFVATINGVPDFRFHSLEKKKNCMKRKLCGICGRKLFLKSYWIISGPVGLKNRVASDAPIHEDCGRYALRVCPHLFFEKSERRTEFDPAQPWHMQAKPTIVFLIKADKIIPIKNQVESVFNYRPVYTERYEYLNGNLAQV